ncbi:MAG: MarR family transcriptional regulator [Granulosicoccaceae bacterium]
MADSLPRPELPECVEELLCFTIYSAGHAFTRAYNPLLKKLNLSYPQYIALTVLWEENELTVGALGSRLKLDSNTMTPLLKRLEKLGYIKRSRGKKDQRQVLVSLAPSGRALQKNASNITQCIIDSTGYNHETLDSLVKTIATLRDNVLQASMRDKDSA